MWFASSRLIGALFVAGLALQGLGWWRQDRLPALSSLVAELAAEPVQLEGRRAAFGTTVGGIAYRVQPLYDYDIAGLVVSKHDADTWWDYIHAAWNDKLNVTDLCVVWGDNALKDRLRDIDFSSDQWTCHFQTSSQRAFETFDAAQISNNHLLTDNARLAKVLRKVRIGDQIRVRGVLAEYSHHHGFAFKRGTSTVRTDTGNGACETIYVDDVQVLRPADALWRRLRWVGLMLAVVAGGVWLTRPFRATD